MSQNTRSDRSRRRDRAAVVEDSARADLLQRYRGLCEKFEAAVSRLQRQAADRSRAAVLALAAMRSRVVALAVVRGRVLLTWNKQFVEMDAGGAVEWRSARDGAVCRGLRQVVLHGAEALAREGDSGVRVERYEGPSGETIDVHVEKLDARPPLVASTIVDVTERVRATRELEAAPHKMLDERMRAIGELASGFAHDFNNALHSMSLWVALVAKGPATPRQRRGFDALARTIRETAVRVGQLQEFARKRHDAPLGCFDLSETVREAVELWSRVRGDGKRPGQYVVELGPNLAADLPAVGSAAELRAVFLSILLNARDAMRQGGTIRIGAEEREDDIVLSFEDEGTGIPQENLARLFDPFFSTKGERGTGMGLSIAHGVMRRLGGSISAANRPEGGAVFTLTFPRAPPAAPESKPEEGAPSRLGQRVLVVDDDGDILEALGMVLEGLGHEAVVEQSGRGAIERVEAGERYDLVLCDVGMPEVNGWDVAERIRALAGDTVVYMVTGWAHEIPNDDPKRALVAGVLPKPLGIDALEKLLAGNFVN